MSNNRTPVKNMEDPAAPPPRKGQLTESTMSYYKRAFENFKFNSYETPENTSIFLANILRQLRQEAIPVCQNQTASRYVETFLTHAQPHHLYYMWYRIICSDWDAFCTDRCTSQVLHKTLLLLPATFDAEDDSTCESSTSSPSSVYAMLLDGDDDDDDGNISNDDDDDDSSSSDDDNDDDGDDGGGGGGGGGKKKKKKKTSKGNKEDDDDDDDDDGDGGGDKKKKKKKKKKADDDDNKKTKTKKKKKKKNKDSNKETGEEEEEADEKATAVVAGKNVPQKEFPTPRASFLQFCAYIDSNLETLINDTYGSHIVRVALHVLANRPMTCPVMTRASKSYNDSTPDIQLKIVKSDESFIKCFFKLSKRLCSLDNPYSYFTHKLANPVYQVLVNLTMTLDKDVGRKLCRKIIKLCGFLDIPPVDPESRIIDPCRLPDLMMDPVATYLAEELLRSCPDDLYPVWYECCFKDRIVAYAVNCVSNYVLHLVIDRCVSKDMCKVIYSEIEPYIEDILALNHFGVIKSLANICLNFGCKQNKFMNSLLHAFHCEEEEKKHHILLLLLTMKTDDVYFADTTTTTTTDSETNNNNNNSNYNNSNNNNNYNNNSNYNNNNYDNSVWDDGSNLSGLPFPVDLHGSLLVQTLLHFDNPSALVAGFHSLSAPSNTSTVPLLYNLICDYKGQHTLKEFFASDTVPKEDQDRLIHSLLPLLHRVACSRFGSRAVQAVWPHLSLQQKMVVAECLARGSMALRRHRYGAFVFYKLQLQLFGQNRDRWCHSVQQEQEQQQQQQGASGCSDGGGGGAAAKKRIFTNILDGTKPSGGAKPHLTRSFRPDLYPTQKK
ncbi:nucleolar protein 9-like, partial [Argonauta hians]